MAPGLHQLEVSVAGVDLLPVLGHADTNLRAIERHYGVEISSKPDQLVVSGPETAVGAAAQVVKALIERAQGGASVTSEDLEFLFSAADGESAVATNGGIVVVGDKRVVKVRSVMQGAYVEAVLAHDIVFGIGPAGTGKTFLAVALAVRFLKEKLVDRVILSRPAVEAGERLGYLPGDLQEKVDPYLRPLYDALHELISPDKLERFMQLGVIEVVPLAYMRGRTLSKAFIILDEAQNATLTQMKMFLTRLGPGSKAVITGDVTQVDLEDPNQSGLIRVQPILRDVSAIRFVYFSEKDVVRHRLVKDIILAFDRSQKQK